MDISGNRYERFENEPSANPEVKHANGEAPPPQQPPPLYPDQPPAYTVQQPSVYGQVKAPTQQTITHVTTTTVAPNDYFFLALFVTFCCCLPLGVVGLIKSGEVKNKIAMGDMAGAQRLSNEARQYSLSGICIGIVIIIVIVVVVVLYSGVLADSH